MVTLDEALLVLVGGPLLFFVGLLVERNMRRSVREGRYGANDAAFAGVLLERARHPFVFRLMVGLTWCAAVAAMLLPLAGLVRLLYRLLTG